MRSLSPSQVEKGIGLTNPPFNIYFSKEEVILWLNMLGIIAEEICIVKLYGSLSNNSWLNSRSLKDLFDANSLLRISLASA